jgi:hypothetical protein
MTYTNWTLPNTFATFGIEQEYNAADCPLYVRNDPINATRNALRDAGLDWIKCIEDGSGGVDVELVFPPAVDCPEFWADYSKAMEVCANLGLRYVQNCGFHVHVGTRRLKAYSNQLAAFWENSKLNAKRNIFKVSDNWLCDISNLMGYSLVKDIMRFYGLNQGFIDKAMPRSRSNPPAASMISNIGWTKTSRAFDSADNLEELKDVIIRWKRDNGARWQTRPKFMAFNVEPYESGTIEFRQHPATLSSKKAANWVRLLINAIETCDKERLTSGNGEAETHTETVITPDCPYRSGSNIGMIYRACRQSGGATVRELSELTGMGRDNIVARISEIRNAIGQDAVLTYTQQHYNHRYGSSAGRYDMGGYEILESYQRHIATPSSAVIIREDAPEDICHNLPYQIARAFMQGPVTRLRA